MISEEDIHFAFQETDDPFVTAKEVSERMGVTRQTAYKHLQRLHEQDRLEKRKIGSSAVIWWLDEAN